MTNPDSPITHRQAGKEYDNPTYDTMPRPL